MEVTPVQKYLAEFKKQEKLIEERIADNKILTERLLFEKRVEDRLQRARRMHLDKGQYVDYYC